MSRRRPRRVTISSIRITADDDALPLSRLVEHPELKLRFIFRPDPVGREEDRSEVIRWAHATEAIDPRPHLRPSELVCTVGSTLLSEADCHRFARAVAAASSAGICFGIGEVHIRPPDALVAECERLNLALVEMSHGVPFLAINDALADARDTARKIRADAAQDRQRIGQLLTLIADRLADPIALIPELRRRGWESSLLCVSTWAPGSGDRILRTHPEALVGDTAQFTYLVAPSRRHAAETALLLGGESGCGSEVVLAQLGRGITESRAAFRLAQERGVPTGPESLTDLAGLLQKLGPAALAPFVDQLIAPLVAHDTARGSALLDTLRTFIVHRGALQTAATDTFLHVNTIRHRLRRVRTLVGRDPLNLDDYIAFSIALWAHDRAQKFER